MRIAFDFDEPGGIRFATLAAKLDLPSDLLAEKLLLAAVEALEQETRVSWPPYLVPCHLCPKRLKLEKARAANSRIKG